ncbi:SH3 domain-containing protein [Pedobacter sp. W3I1]|uniref:SH3 domain-containing protein n=1 Tax=Pedobacter sp. W3I1 TaxID=3042291 RepID=UPI003593513D
METALNLRTGPSLTSRKKKVILKGDYLSEISREDEWSNVVFEGIKGYVNNRYLVNDQNVEH